MALKIPSIEASSERPLSGDLTEAPTGSSWPISAVPFTTPLAVDDDWRVDQ